jgi:hypothetical protein
MISSFNKHFCPKAMLKCSGLICSLTLLSISLFSFQAVAQPDMARKYVFDSVAVYRDARINTRFYYVPGDLQVAFDSDGKPDFRLLLMRYTGTTAYDDRGTNR